MDLRTDFFLAWRYFLPKRNAVSVITLISVIGVMLGVGVLIIVLSVMGGFRLKMQEKLLDTSAHLQIENAVGYRGISSADSAKLVKDAKKFGIELAPVLMGYVLIQQKSDFRPKMLIGIDPNSKTGMFSKDKLEKIIKHGNFSLKANEVLISPYTANKFGVGVGDKILLHAPRKLSKIFEVQDSGAVKISPDAELYLPNEYIVSGIFKFGEFNFDNNTIFMGLDDADELFNLPWGTASTLYGWVKNPFKMNKEVDELSGYLEDNFNNAYYVNTWKVMHQHILGVLNVEKNMMFFLLVFIVLVAAFSIANTLITMVIQKTREIGVLKAIGARSSSIAVIFVMQGLFVGVLGVISGIILAVVIVNYRNDLLHFLRKITGQDIFPPEFYHFDGLPATISWEYDIPIVALSSIILCAVGAVIPAIKAARLDAAKALRYE